MGEDAAALAGSVRGRLEPLRDPAIIYLLFVCCSATRFRLGAVAAYRRGGYNPVVRCHAGKTAGPVLAERHLTLPADSAKTAEYRPNGSADDSKHTLRFRLIADRPVIVSWLANSRKVNPAAVSGVGGDTTSTDTVSNGVSLAA